MPLPNGDKGWVWVVMREDVKVALYEDLGGGSLSGTIARLADLETIYPNVDLTCSTLFSPAFSE